MGSGFKEKIVAFFGTHGKKIALGAGAVFVFVAGVTFGGGGSVNKLTASLLDAWNFSKGAFSRAPVAEFDLNSRDGGISGVGITDNILPTKKECDFDADVTSDKSIIINEVAWMGTNESYRSEWIEFTNLTDKTIDLSGWKLTDESGKFLLEFSADAKIDPRKFYVAVKKGISIAGIKSRSEFSGSIRNSDQTLKLFDADCMVRDVVVADPSWPAGENDTKQTMERNIKTLTWHTSKSEGGTPGTQNSIGVPVSVLSLSLAQKSVEKTTNTLITSKTAIQVSEPVAESIIATCSKKDGATTTHEILINEVAWAGTASDKTSHEWIELKNNSGKSVLLKGWQVMNSTRSLRFVFPDIEIFSEGFVLMERTDDETLPNIEADVIYSGSLKNSDESLQLFNATCTLSDEAEANIGTAKTWPAGITSPEYRSMERGSDFSWHSFIGSPTNGIYGTPKKQNTINASTPITSINNATLSVSKTGTGSGVIVSEPAGISCGSVCSYSFSKNSVIKLTAVPDSDSRFAGWGGCVGSGECSIALSGDMAIAGEFQKVSAPLPIVPTVPSPVINSGHLLISAIQVSGSVADDEYIAVFNPTGSAVPLVGWSIQYRGSSATTFYKKNFETTHSILSGASFVIANPLYVNAVSADMTHSSFKLSVTGGTIFLVSTTTLMAVGNESAITDKVAYGSGTYLFPEGTVYPDVPPASQILSRKNSGGILQDTDNNSADFEIK